MNITVSALESMSIKDIRSILTENQVPGRSAVTRRSEIIEFFQKWQRNERKKARETKKNRLVITCYEAKEKKTEVEEESNEEELISIPVCPMEPEEVLDDLNVSILYIYLLEKNRNIFTTLNTKSAHISFARDETITLRGFKDMTAAIINYKREGLAITTVSISYQGWKQSHTCILVINSETKRVELLDLMGYDGLRYYLEDAILRRYRLKRYGWKFSTLEGKWKDSSEKISRMWLVKIADLRFQNPSSTLKNLARKLEISLKSYNHPSEYIEKYSKFLISYRDVFIQDLVSKFFMEFGRNPSKQEVKTIIFQRLKKFLSKKI